MFYIAFHKHKDHCMTVTIDTIVNCYDKALRNSLIDAKDFFNIPEIEQDINIYECYQNYLTEEELFAELKHEIESCKSPDENSMED